MKTKLFLLVLPVMILFASCESDKCNQTVTYTKATAIYQDMDELRNVALNNNPRSIENAGKIFVGDDFLLIGEEGQGIHVIDNRDENNPSPINFLNLPMTREFMVDGDKIYAESHYDLVEIDITDLNNAQITNRALNYIDVVHTNEAGQQLVGFTYEEVTEELPCDSHINSDAINYLAWNNELIPVSSVPSSFTGSSSGQSGTLNRIAKSDDNLFLVTNDDLHVFESGSGLRKVNTLNSFDFGMETIIIRDQEAFIGKVDGMTIVDISNAASPEITNEYFHEEACDPVLPYQDVAYVTLRVGGPCQGFQNLLDVVDINRQTRFSRLSAIVRIPMESPYGMTIADNILYVGEGTNGLKEFDITDPNEPQLISWNQDIEAYDIILHPTKDILLLAGPDGLSQYDKKANSLVSNITY